MAPSNLPSGLAGPDGSGLGTPAAAQPPAKRPPRPGPLRAMGHILYRLHHVKPLGVMHEVPQTLVEDLTARIKFGLHVSQRTARILGTLLVRVCVKHPLGWTIPQEVICMLMYGILQSRQVPAWRAFFQGVGDLQAWAPVTREQVTTGSCVSWWIRLQPDKRPQQPQASINWLFLHGGAFIAGDALMYTAVFTYWMLYLAQQGIECSMLSVEYPLAPEHPFPAGVNAAADAIHWLVHDSGETADYLVGGDSAGGNLALASLTLLRDGGKLSRLPLGITLISPAVDLSNASVFGSSEPVSSHFEQQQQQDGHSCGHDHQQQRQHGFSSSNGAAGVKQSAAEAEGRGGSAFLPNGSGSGSRPAGESAAGSLQGVKPSPGVAQLLLGGSFRQRHTQQQQQQQQQQDNNPDPQQQQQQGAMLESQGSFNVAKQQLEQQHVPLEHQPSVDCKMHAAHTAGGRLRPWQLFTGLLGEALTALRVHSSSSTAQQQAAAGWFDYIPSDSFADELHCYLPDPKLLTHPLVSPTYLRDFTGLCQAGMLVVAGGAELMRPDIHAFAQKAAAAAAGAGGGARGAAKQSRAGAAAAAAAAPAAPPGDSAQAASAAGEAAARPAAAGSGRDGSNGGSSSGSSSGSNGASFAVLYHEEPNEPHVFCMLTLPHLLRKGRVVPRFVAAVVKGQPLDADTLRCDAAA